MFAVVFCGEQIGQIDVKGAGEEALAENLLTFVNKGFDSPAVRIGLPSTSDVAATIKPPADAPALM